MRTLDIAKDGQVIASLPTSSLGLIITFVECERTVAMERSSIQCEGPIPETLSLLQSLQELWLNGNRLTGSIPEGLGRLPHLRELYLNANELVGGIPSSFSELVGLEGLNLSWNKLSGDFPSCLGNMVRISCLVCCVFSMFESDCFVSLRCCRERWESTG